MRSVPDVLLEDYNVKFSLGISLGEQLTRAIGVLTGRGTKEELEKSADYIVHNLREISPILS
jgi:phosphoglycolate phosphatase-like HAD superfamily hydrolase